MGRIEDLAVTDYHTFVLPDGCVRVWVGDYCGTVSSWHLVEPKVRQLVKLNAAGLLQPQQSPTAP